MEKCDADGLGILRVEVRNHLWVLNIQVLKI